MFCQLRQPKKLSNNKEKRNRSNHSNPRLQKLEKYQLVQYRNTINTQQCYTLTIWQPFHYLEIQHHTQEHLHYIYTSQEHHKCFIDILGKSKKLGSNGKHNLATHYQEIPNQHRFSLTNAIWQPI